MKKWISTQRRFYFIGLVGFVLMLPMQSLANNTTLHSINKISKPAKTMEYVAFFNVSNIFTGSRSTSGFLLTWDYISAIPDSVYISRSDGSGGYMGKFVLPGNRKSFLDTTFSYGQTYFYSIAILSKGQKGQYMNINSPVMLNWNSLKLRASTFSSNTFNLFWDYIVQVPDRVDVYVNDVLTEKVNSNSRSCLLKNLCMRDRITINPVYSYYMNGNLYETGNATYLYLSDSLERGFLSLVKDSLKLPRLKFYFSGKYKVCQFILQSSRDGINYSDISPAFDPKLSDYEINEPGTLFFRLKRIWGTCMDYTTPIENFQPTFGPFRRLVLHEFFQGENCFPSTSLEQKLNLYKPALKDTLVTLSYFTYSFYSNQLSRPGGDGTTRFSYYNIQAIPTSFLNGAHRTVGYNSNFLNDFSQTVNKEKITSSPFVIRCASQVFPDEKRIHLRVVVYGSGNILGGLLKLHVAVVEKQISKEKLTGYSGFGIPNLVFEDVVRKMFPDGNGTRLKNNWNMVDSVVYEFNWNYSGLVYDPAQLGVVAFIQEQNSQYVYQCGAENIKQEVIIKPRPFILPGAWVAFPNPTAGHLYLASPKAEVNNLKLLVYNQAGQLVADPEVSPTSESGIFHADISMLKNGVYQYVLTGDGINHTQKIILNR